jgi:hypothetical protein
MGIARAEIDSLRVGETIVFRVHLLDGAGAVVTGGTTSLYLYELQDDGTLESYDFDDDTFKTTALTTETLSLTHRAGNNGTTNTGFWTGILSTLTGLTEGGLYLVRVTNANASPPERSRQFGYGGVCEDSHLARCAMMNKRTFTVATGVDVVYDEDGVTVKKTLTPAEAAGVVTRTPS